MLKNYSKNVTIFVGISLFIILFDLAVVKPLLYKNNDPLLTLGVSLDFVVVIPLLLYFLIYRQLNKKMISILPFALVGFFALVLLIPNTHQGTLQVVKYLVIPLELMFLGYELHKIYQFIINLKHYRRIGSHPMETIRKSIEASFSNTKIASLLVHDVSVFYYALLSWRKRPYVRTDSTSFSYHTQSNWLITILILSKILLIEGVCIHILLMNMSHTAAWLLSLGNVYVIILLAADYRAMCLNPILVSKQEINLQYGIQMLSHIDLDNIESVSVIKFVKLTKHELKSSFTPLVTEPNIRIRLKSKVTVIRMFGKRQNVDQIYLFLDKPDEFQAKCLKLMDKENNGD